MKTSSSCQPHPQNGKAYIQTELCRSVACCNVPGDPKESERNQSLKSESSSVVPLSGDGMGGGSGDGRGRCGWGPTRGWEVWPGSGDGGGRCGRTKTITKSYQKDGGTQNHKKIISRKRRHSKTIRKSYQENGGTPKP